MSQTTKSNCIVVITTSDDRSELEKISALLVREQLAACCQISGPIASHYTWEGKVEKATEWRCEIKTINALFAKVEQAIRKNHHYDEPEIVWFRIDGGSDGYLAWVRASVRSEN